MLTNYKLIGPERCGGVKQFDFDELAISYKNYFIKEVDFFFPPPTALSNALMLRTAEDELHKPGEIIGILINICHFLLV